MTEAVGLRISGGITLPESYVTQTTAILAQRRAGKSYTAAVIAEELADMGAPFVVLDPTGAWWGLRGEAVPPVKYGRGLPVVILGGSHGDLPLEDTAGRVVADLVVDEPGFYVLDLSGWDTRAAEVRFALAFADRLYRRKGAIDKRFPLHLFVDEAELFAPQRVDHGETKLLGAIESIVKRGGIRGIGTTLISQRAASLNKNVLEQVDRLILLRTVGPNDRKAVDAYVSAFASPEQRGELMGSIAALDLGEAWVYEPGADVLKRVRIRLRRTFNSSATPKHGEVRIEPKKLADVDLVALQERMAATIEKAKADDPAVLRAEIKRLERELAAKRSPVQEKPTVVEVQVIDTPLMHSAISALDRATFTVDEMIEAMRPILATADEKLKAAAADIGRSLARVDGTQLSKPVLDRPEVGTIPAAVDLTSERDSNQPSVQGTLPKAQRLILSALAQHERGLTRTQIGMLTGYSAKGGNFANAIGALRSAGYITPTEPHQPTDAGLTALGGYTVLPTGRALFEHWLSHPRLGKAERSILEALATGAMTKDEIAEATGYAASGGNFANALGRLRTLGLIIGGTKGTGVVIELEETLADAVREPAGRV